MALRVGVVDVELAGDLVDGRVLLGGDRSVRGADREARAKHVDPLFRRGQRLELARDAVVFRTADRPGLELGHLGHQHGRRLVEPVVGLELTFDRRGLVVADVEVGVRSPCQRVGGRCDQVRPLRRHRLQSGDDPADRGGLAGRPAGIDPRDR